MGVFDNHLEWLLQKLFISFLIIFYLHTIKLTASMFGNEILLTIKKILQMLGTGTD